MKKLVAILLTMLMVFSAGAALAEGSLVVYSPHDADPLQAGLALFEKAYPDIKVEIIAAGTGLEPVNCCSALPQKAKTPWPTCSGAAAPTPWRRSNLTSNPMSAPMTM